MNRTICFDGYWLMLGIALANNNKDPWKNGVIVNLKIMTSSK